MTLGTAFKKTKLSTVIVTSLLLATSCTTLNSERQSLETNKPNVTQTSDSEADILASDINGFEASTWSKKLASCSGDYKKLIEPEINKFSGQSLAYDRLFATNNPNVDLANQLQANETLECKESALALAEQMNRTKIELTQQQLKEQNLSEKDKIEALSNLRNAEQALFFSYVRHGFIVDEEQDVQLWLNAEDIWSQWLNQPVVLEDADSIVNSLIINKTMISSVTQLTDYLQNYATEVNKKPKKKELLLNQTLILLAQSEANNRAIRQSLDKASESLPWLKSMTAQLTNEFNIEQDSTKQGLKNITVNDTESALTEFLQRDENQYFTQLLKLTALRYQQFNEQQLLESGKTFLVEEVEDLAFSELLTAMDYAKTGDMESSKRWLDKAFANNDIANQICKLPTLDPGSLNPFFKQKNGQKLLAIINEQCS